MNYSMSSELSTIVYGLEQQAAKLDVFLATNKEELIKLGIYNQVNNGFLELTSAIYTASEVF